MYSSRGTNAYGQQSSGGQSGYTQDLGAGYSGSSVRGLDGGAQMSSWHSSILDISQEAEVGRYRALPSISAHYGGQYSSLYGTTALSTIQQVPAISSKGAGASTLEVRSAYASAMPDSPNLVSSDYVSSSSHRYSHKAEQMYAEKIPDYPTVERRQYDERRGVYKGRELPSEATGRYADSANFSHKFKPDIYDRVDQAILHRPEQSLKAQSTSIDGILRQVDYLPARGAASRHSTQDHMPYEGRVDSDPRSLSFLIASYGGQLPSILGAAPRKNVDDLMHPPNSANPGYGVSLPPGRDYGTKGLHATSIESEYPGSALSHIGHPRIKYKDDGAGYLREIEFREEERRRDQLREREKDREREREKERERLRDRERERERLRLLERREKERERERKRALQVTRKRTRTVSKNNRGPSLSKEVHPVRRDPPCCEASHRRLSPVKEKRREYVCKVYSSTLVDVERDYMSINKRYPRLFVSAEFSKVVINWPKEDIKLSMHTPVSFEHDFVEDSMTESKELPNKLLPVEPEKPEQGSTIWNAKMILMSGLSKSALEELSSEKLPDDRIPHICNILRFAVLKREHSLMAIGGPWVSADGTNPANANSPLIQTVLRYAKDVVGLDLQNCQHWNRFLEIHYDRVGKDGLFSHKEVTVLFVPDLSECLPSFDTWRAQWLAHRKSVSEREHRLSLKREKSKDRKEGLKDKVADSTKHTERGKLEKRTQSVSSSHSVAANRKEKNGTSVEVNVAEGKVSAGESKVEVKDGSEITVGGDPEIKVSGEAVTVKTGAVKSVKKKVIKRIVKRKVAYKTAAEVNTISNQGDKVDEDVGENSKSEIPSILEEPSAGCADQSKATVSPTEAKVETQMGCSEDKAKDNSDAVVPAVENASLKTIVKRKIIKRVPKRKVPATQVTDEVAEIKKDRDEDEDEKKVVQIRSEASNIGKQTGPEEQGNAAISSKSEIKANKENKKDEKVTNMESLNDKQKVNTKSSDVKGVKLKEGENPKDEKNGKVKSQGSPKKELNETRKSEEPPPKHPGFILQTRWSKDSKFCSSSRSLDSLLEYTEKDIEESTSELSLFAEALYEMLQYQMGCRILTFLQKLRVRFITKRNQLKRQREEICVNEIQKKSPTKRLKSDELPLKNVLDTSNEAPQTLQEEKLIVTKEETTADNVEEPKTEDEIADEENEEDPEEYEEMDDVSQQINSSNEKNEEKTDIDAKPEQEAEQDEAVESTNEEITTKATITEPGPDGGDMSGKTELKVDPKKKVHAVDKDLLQAFRFFDRNRVGYIRVDDLRLIIHNMGKFLSYRDVKELVQSALLDTNTGRDDHILYNKLVHMSDI